MMTLVMVGNLLAQEVIDKIFAPAEIAKTSLNFPNTAPWPAGSKVGIRGISSIERTQAARDRLAGKNASLRRERAAQAVKWAEGLGLEVVTSAIDETVERPYGNQGAEVYLIELYRPARSTTLEARAVRRENGLPLEGVKIFREEDGTRIAWPTPTNNLTPVKATDIDPGSYTFVAVHDGYHDSEKEVEISEYDEMTITFGMSEYFEVEETENFLNLSINPADGARWSLDGKPVQLGVTQITEGDHLLRVSKPGYATIDTVFAAVLGDTATMDIALQPLLEDDDPPPVVQTDEPDSAGYWSRQSKNGGAVHLGLGYASMESDVMYFPQVGAIFNWNVFGVEVKAHTTTFKKITEETEHDLYYAAAVFMRPWRPLRLGMGYASMSRKTENEEQYIYRRYECFLVSLGAEVMFSNHIGLNFAVEGIKADRWGVAAGVSLMLQMNF